MELFKTLQKTQYETNQNNQKLDESQNFSRREQNQTFYETISLNHSAFLF